MDLIKNIGIKFLVPFFFLLLTIGVGVSYSQPPNNCEICYSTYFNDEAALAQCLSDFNCNVDIPIDTGMEFLFLGGLVLVFLSKKKFKLVN